MASDIEAVEADVRDAVESGFRENLLARGQARSMIWKDGKLPPDAPPFSNVLSYDLLSYGYSLLAQGLRLMEGGGSHEIARMAFEHAADAIEAVIAKGPEARSRDFHRLVAAASYHIGRYSARAFSLLHSGLHEANLTQSEICLASLMLRDLDGLNAQLNAWRVPGLGADDGLVAMLEGVFDLEDANDVDPTDESPEGQDVLDVAVVALTDNYMSAMAIALLGFERGEVALIRDAVTRLKTGLAGCAELSLVPQWWCYRLTIHLLGDLWDSSFHRRLPAPEDGSPPKDWTRLRELFIATLYRRSKAEIELWPSQLEAADRALDQTDNMVVSLPTSAGKTRVAELCILSCLAAGRRVVFVTPLRALSAQTEIGLQRTFMPLGKTVSSLYGSIGASDVDEDILRDRNIVVATPEKLDFALRNDPTLLDDVGLVVLDEGHMIGLNEREVRYEVQVQRLLKRSDAASRRIVCLSAILPSGTELDDFVAWLTHGEPEGLLHENWRPTRLRFGEVDWKGSNARLNIRVGDETPFIPKFLSATVPPKMKRKEPVPRNQRELCLATAWRLMEEGQSVLIFCPERRSVEPFATAIVDLEKRGVLSSVLAGSIKQLGTVLAIGAEWFGPDHDLLKCLKLGVAIHHGALPTPYRREVEQLLRMGVLRLTVSSPTLAQGLNLSASTLVMFGIERSGEIIETSEFRNIIGRAGRAYVDLEGLILYPMFDDHAERRRKWKQLSEDTAGKEMESGLLRLLVTLLKRMGRKLKTNSVAAIGEYVANNASAWAFPEVTRERARFQAIEQQNWGKYIASLDTAILSLIGEEDVGDDEIEAKLEEVLGASLFNRRLNRQNESVRNLVKTALVTRTKYIWDRTTEVQRRGYFLSGLGFDSGQQLDAHAPRLEEYLAEANRAIRQGEVDAAIESITLFAEIVFEVAPFSLDRPDNWKEVLVTWLKGQPIAPLAADGEAEVLQFIEGGLAYRLPWAMEAVRVRAVAHADPDEADWAAPDIETGEAVAAVETGTLNRSAALLMRAGFGARLAAIKAVNDSDGEFTTIGQLRAWLASAIVKALEWNEDWPSPESRLVWESFKETMAPAARQTWSKTREVVGVDWEDGYAPAQGAPLRITRIDEDDMILAADCERVGTLKKPVNADRKGLLKVTVATGANGVVLDYLGPEDLYVV